MSRDFILDVVWPSGVPVYISRDSLYQLNNWGDNSKRSTPGQENPSAPIYFY